MEAALILATIFGGIVLALAIIGSTVLMAIKLIKGGVSRRSRETQTNEAKMIQEIYRGLSKMEKRIEALETIILEKKERKADHEQV